MKDLTLRTADLAGPSPHPAEEPQRANDLKQDYTQNIDGPNNAPGEMYLWVCDGRHILVGPKSGLPVLSLWRQMTGTDEMHGPYAHGSLEVIARWNSEWMVRDSNISLHLLQKMMKKYSKDMGWKYRAITDESGMPFEGFKTAAYPGIGDNNPGIKDWKNTEWGDSGQWDQMSQVDYYGEQDPVDDEPAPGPRVCSECGTPCPDYDSWRIHVERSHINPDRKPNPLPHPVIDLDQQMPADFNTLVMDKTVQRQSGMNGGLPDGMTFESSIEPKGTVILRALVPEIGVVGALRIAGPDTDQPKHEGVQVYPNFQRRGVATALWQEAQRLYPNIQVDGLYSDAGAEWARATHPGIELQPYDGSISGPTWRQAAQPQIAGPLPFIYDIEKDRVFVGHPGERHSDIPGRFTPGGIIEGQYTPDGKVEIRTDTDMPYTVRHMVELWYAMHPELVVKGVVLIVGEKQYKLASSNIGNKVRNLAFTDPAVQEVYGPLAHYGNVFVVGGAVRDVILGKLPKDFDLMVQGIDAATLDAILRSLPGYVAESVDSEGQTEHVEGKAYGIFRYVTQDGHDVEVALPRAERSTGDSNADFEVQHDPFMSVEQDMSRRDFTCNSMAVNLATADLIDPYNGVQDTREGVLRTTNEDAFTEDPVRIVRALTAMSKHGFHLDPPLEKMLKENAHRIKTIKEHRTYQELDKLFAGDDPARAMEKAYDLNLIHHMMPEAAAAHDFDQKSKYHRHLLHHHMLDVLRRTAEQSPDKDLRLAAFLHDIGKPASQWMDEDGYGHYYYDKEGDRGAQHADVGAEMAHSLLTRLNYPGKRVKRIEHLIQHHMFPPFSGPNGAKKFLKNVGSEHAADLLKLRRADGGGKGINEFENTVPVELQEQLVQNVLHHNEPYSLKDLAVNGHDLMEAGIPEGPELGKILNQLADAVLENPALNDPETLKAMAQQWNAYNAQPTHMPQTLDAEGQPLAEPTQQKQAAAQVWYHVAPREQRESIMQQGLSPEFDQTGVGAVYLDSERPDQDYVDEGKDIWAVNIDGLQLEDDTSPEAAYDTWKMYRGVVPPGRLQLANDGQRQSNILDPIHETLDPDVFDNADQHAPSVKPRIIRWVTEHVYKVMRDNAWPDPSKYLTLVLTGSLTTYQWSHHSDFDVSLWVDAKTMPEWVRADLIKLMIHHVDGTIVPGTTHPIQCYVIPPLVRREQLYKPGLRSGYDLDTQKWIVKPERNRTVDVERDMPNLIQLCRWVEDKMRMMLRYHPDAAKILWDGIHHARQRDMRAGKGDYAESNVIYKWLASHGLFPMISNVTGEYIASARMENHGWTESHTSAEEAPDAEGTPGAQAEGAEGVWSSPAASGSQPDSGDAGAAQPVAFNWPTAEGVIALGPLAVDNWQGVRDPNSIHAAIGATMNQHYYGGTNDVFELAAHLINNIQRQQGIVEGNKRTATASGIAFLMDHGYPEAINLLQDEPLPMPELQDSDLPFSQHIVAMAEGRETPEQLANYMRRHVSHWQQHE